MPHSDDLHQIDKHALRQQLIDTLVREIETLKAAADETRRGAVHEESRPENDKDTRALEATYLARGQAQRVEEMEEGVTKLRFVELRAYTEDDRVSLGALVAAEIEDDDGDLRQQTYFLLPFGGGQTLSPPSEPSTENAVQVVTPTAPLGRRLLGCEVGDSFSRPLRGPGTSGALHYEIVAIA